jgi:hypothetical protein
VFEKYFAVTITGKQEKCSFLYEVFLSTIHLAALAEFLLSLLHFREFAAGEVAGFEFVLSVKEGLFFKEFCE